MADHLLPAIVRAVRLSRGLTQEALGSKAGVSKVAVSQWEGGASGLSEATLERVASALELSVRELLVEGLRLTAPPPTRPNTARCGRCGDVKPVGSTGLCEDCASALRHDNERQLEREQARRR